MRWSDVAAFPTGGVASAGRPRGPAVGSGGGSELEQAIERALEQRLRPLQSIIAELKRENAILKAENSKLKGEAPRPQQPPQQVMTPPPPAPRCSTPSRPEAAGMDTDDASSSWEGADGSEDRPCTAKRIALDPARHETDRGGRYEKLQKQIDTIENSLDERFAKQAAQMNDMFNGAIAKLSEQMTQMLTAHMARIENIEARLPQAAGRPIRTMSKPYARQQQNQQQQNLLTDADTQLQPHTSRLDGDGPN